MVASVEQSALIKVENKDDNRKRNKPIMEKRRRARINHCLNELKALILDTMKKDPSTHSKLEKADILEMTVKHLGGLRSCEPDRFRAGYRRCLFEVARFPGLEVDLKRKLVRHLEGLMPGTRPPVACTPPSDTDDATVSSFLISASSCLVPSRLSNGDIAFLLPASLKHTLERIPRLAPLSPKPFSAVNSRGSPTARPLPLVTRKTLEDKPWRPW